MSFTVSRVPAELSYPLRQQVLRPHQQVADLRLPGDDDTETGTFAARSADGTVWGTAAVRRETCPWQPERADAWRLRGMATADGMRGQGVGAAVLAVCVKHVRAYGGRLLWCHARTPAVVFYQRAGFTTYGAEWDEPPIGPHVRMWRVVADPPPAGPASR